MSDKYYEIKAGDRTFKIKVPNFIQKGVKAYKSLTTPDAERNPGPKAYGQPSREFKNVAEREQLRQLDDEMRSVGRSASENAAFGKSYDEYE